jgi:hypothetical protein
MARNAVGITLGQQIGESTYNSSGAAISTASGNLSALDTAVDLTVTDSALMQGTLKTNVAAAVAQLVTDAGSPTQGHVTTLNTAWGLLSTAMTTVDTDALAAQVLSDAAVAETSSANLVVDYDAAIITNMNQLRAALRSALLTLAGSGTPTL